MSYFHRYFQFFIYTQKQCTVAMTTATNLRVQNPMSHNTTDGKFTSYVIIIETENIAFSLKKSNIRRRYSEFVWFRDILARNHPDVNPPSLPRKTFFQNRFEAGLIEERRNGLEQFLNRVISETRYLSDNTVHLFLQSPLSIQDIDVYLRNPKGQTVATMITAHVEQAQGVCPDCSGVLYPEDGEAAPTPPGNLPGVSNSNAQPCPHDIFSPTRPHSFDFSHCVMSQSRSYDSSDDSNLEKEMLNVSAAK